MKTKTASLVVAFLVVAFSAQAFAGTVYWDRDAAADGGSTGTTATGVWDQNTTANWNASSNGLAGATGTYQTLGGATPDAVFSAGTDVTGASTVTITGSVSANSILVEEGNIVFAGASTPVLTLGGSTGAGITISSASASNSSFGATVTSIVLNGAQSWDVIDSARTLSTSTATIITGSGPLTINNASNALGRVTLANDTGLSNFAGGVVVKGGTLAIDANLNTLASVSSAGTGSITLGDSSGSRNVTLQHNTNSSKTFNNAIIIASGSTGNTILIQNNPAATNGTTFAGGVTMNRAVTLQSNGGGGSGTLNFSTNNIVTNGHLITAIAANNANLNISSVITGSGGLTVNSSGSGTVTLTGANAAWNGPITLTSGKLSAGTTTAGGGFLGSGAISMANGTSLIFAASSGNGTNYQNGAVTIASGTGNVSSPGSSSRLRAIGQFNLGVGGTGSTLAVDPGIQSLASSGVQLLGNSTIDVTPTGGAANGTFNVYGGVSNSGGSYNLTKTGAGILSLGGNMNAATDVPALVGVASTYGGDTNISAGTIRVGSTNALPTGTNVSIASGATLSLSHIPGNTGIANFNQQVAGLSDLGGGGTVTANDTTTNLASARTLTLGGAGTYAFSGNLVNNTNTGSGLLALAKTGSGTQTLGGGANTYSGPTTVSGGTLLVNGSLTASSSVTVAVGATLGGAGTIASDTTVNGTLSAGNSPGLLTFNDAGAGIADLTLAGTANSYFEINGNVRGTSYDAIDVEGLLTLGGTLTLDFGYTPLISDTFDLFNFANQVGSFSSVVFVDSGYAGSFDAGTGILSLSAIPEPSTYAMLIGGLGLLALLRRRNHA